ncbi:probable enoyl-CoA hydratase echA8 [Watersipora subatra]|uniref:probable enoyl-CoA hydratase echA8 n=1 Tax=Watersipora subatra TaxID=2589382 RepID=UPI00355B2C6D
MATSAERLKTIKQHLQRSTRFKCNLLAYTPEYRKYEYVKVRVMGVKRNIGLIELYRPKSLNAIFDPLMMDISNALDELEIDDTIGCVIITGSNKSFSVGADIKQLASTSNFSDTYKVKFPSNWDKIASFRKPLIAAVNGYAYGGGCEIAMMCDIIYAGDSAKFDQPEIKIGTIPGAGGTQRLPRLVGKSKAMEMILSGDPINAEEAKEYGLVADVFPASQLLSKVLEKAERIASNSHLITAMAKEAVGKAFELPLAEGLNFEQKIFHSTFATADRLEGMMAFIEKRQPEYTNE